MTSLGGRGVRRWLLVLGLLLVACGREPAPEVHTSYLGPTPPGAVARLGKGAIEVVGFSPDGNFLAVGGGVGLTLYEAETLEEVWLEPTFSPVLSLAFAPDGRFLAAGLQNGTLILLDAERGEIIGTVPGDDEANGVFALAWSPEDVDETGAALFAAGFNDGTLLLFTLAETVNGPDVTELGELERHQSGITSLAFAPDGSVLASGNRTGVVNLWDVQTSARLAVLREHESAHAVLALSWSPDGAALVSGGRDEQVIVWDVATQSPRRTFTEHGAQLLSIAFIPDTPNVATVSSDGTVFLWEVETGTIAYSQSDNGQETVSAASSPTGTSYAIAAANGSLLLRPFDVDGGASDGSAQTLTGHAQAGRWVTGVAWSPDGKRLASTLGSDVIVWNATTYEPLRVFTEHTTAVTSIAWEAGGRRLASGDREGGVLIWDGETGEQLVALTGHTDDVASLSWSPDGSRLASAGSLDDSAIIWDAQSGEPLHTLHGDGAGLWSVAWSPDGETLAVGTTIGVVRLWNVAGSGAPQLRDSQRRHLSWVAGMAWSPDGTRLASAGADNRIVLWEIVSGDTLALAGHSHVVRDVAFSPDGNRLASAARDELVIVWDVGPEAEDNPLEVLVGHTEGVNAVAWSPDGTTFASGSDDGTVILWD